MIPLTQMQGAEKLPKNMEMPSPHELDFGGKETSRRKGHNSAVSQLEGLAVGVDVEKLKEILENPHQECCGRPGEDCCGCPEPCFCPSGQAQALAASSAEWLKLVRVE